MKNMPVLAMASTYLSLAHICLRSQQVLSVRVEQTPSLFCKLFFSVCHTASLVISILWVIKELTLFHMTIEDSKEIML